jgi:hypothetical protein
MDDSDLPLQPEKTAFSQTCGGCGRSFAQLNAFTNHSSSCPKRKRKFSTALAVAQEAYRRKKERRFEAHPKNSLSPPLASTTTNPGIVEESGVVKVCSWKRLTISIKYYG